MTGARAASVALLYPGDRAARDRADPAASRFAALFEALAAAGVKAEPAVYHDDFADEVAAQLRRVQAVLVWCNPIEDGRRRDRLDALLREVAKAGVLVSAHPEAILRLGTKDVLFETRDLPFGSDVHRIDSLAQLEIELPQRLRQGARTTSTIVGLRLHSGRCEGRWRGALRALRNQRQQRVAVSAIVHRAARRSGPAQRPERSTEHPVKTGLVRMTVCCWSR